MLIAESQDPPAIQAHPGRQAGLHVGSPRCGGERGGGGKRAGWRYVFCVEGGGCFPPSRCSFPPRSILPAPTLRLDPRHHARQVLQVLLQERVREALQGDFRRAPHDHLHGVSLLARALKRYHHADPSWENDGDQPRPRLKGGM